jgi:hypothetical protein
MQELSLIADHGKDVMIFFPWKAFSLSYLCNREAAEKNVKSGQNPIFGSREA